MIEIKEIRNTITQEEFVSKTYLLEIARNKINAITRVACKKVLFSDWYVLYHRIDATFIAYCELGLFDEEFKERFLTAVLNERQQCDEFFGVPQLNSNNEIYYI